MASGRVGGVREWKLQPGGPPRRVRLQFEGEALGELRVDLDEVQLESLAERSANILDRIEAVRADISSYPVEIPERDLAWYINIEFELGRGRSRAQWSGFEEVLATGDTSEFPADDSMAVGAVTRNVLLAEVSAVNAEQFRDRLRERLGSTWSYEPHLRSENDRLDEQRDELPTQNEILDRYVGDTAERGPYEFVHNHLARLLFPTSVQPPWQVSIDGEFLASQALAKARKLADWRAHETVIGRMEIEPDDEGFDPIDVLDAKRSGYDTYEELIGPDPSPFLCVFAEQGIGNLRVVDIDRDWDDDWSPWQERVQAYLYALLGAARPEAYPPLYDRLITG